MAAAQEIGYPAVCKTAMPGLQHKTEQRGVKLGLADEIAVRAAYTDLGARLGPRVLVTRMAEPGIELVLVRPGQPLPRDATLVILPGSKATLADLAFMRDQGWDIDILAHYRSLFRDSRAEALLG